MWCKWKFSTSEFSTVQTPARTPDGGHSSSHSFRICQFLGSQSFPGAFALGGMQSCRQGPVLLFAVLMCKKENHSAPYIQEGQVLDVCIFPPLPKLVHVTGCTPQEALCCAFWHCKARNIKGKELSVQRGFLKCYSVYLEKLAKDAARQYYTGKRGHKEFLGSDKKAEQTNSLLEGLS